MFTAELSQEALQVRMSADLSLVDRLADMVRTFLTDNGLDSEIFCVLLVTREAMVNAIIHGSHGDGMREVEFSLRYEKGRHLLMQVRDQGVGFDWRNMADVPPEADTPHGRGLVIMQSYMDTMAFEEEGRTVILTKHLAGERE